MAPEGRDGRGWGRTSLLLSSPSSSEFFTVSSLKSWKRVTAAQGHHQAGRGGGVRASGGLSQ